MIPEEAIEAAAKELVRQDLSDGHTLEDALLAQGKWRRRAYHAEQILSAALPHLEAAIRKQIADDIQERLVPADQTEVAVWIRNQAARIVQEGKGTRP